MTERNGDAKQISEASTVLCFMEHKMLGGRDYPDALEMVLADRPWGKRRNVSRSPHGTRLDARPTPTQV